MIIVTTCHDLSGCGSLTCCTSSQAGLHTWPEPSAQVASRQVACLKDRAFRTWACDACTASIALRVHPPVLLEASETSLGRSDRKFKHCPFWKRYLFSTHASFENSGRDWRLHEAAVNFAFAKCSTESTRAPRLLAGSRRLCQRSFEIDSSAAPRWLLAQLS